MAQYDYTVSVSGGNTYSAVNNAGATVSNTDFGTLMNTLSGSVFIKKGVYPCSTLIDYSVPIKIIGEGTGLTIIRRTKTSSGEILKFHGNNNLVTNLTIDGNYPANSNNTTSEVTTFGDYNTFNTVEFINCYTAGITYVGTGTKFVDCVFTGVIGNTTNERTCYFGAMHFNGNSNQYTEYRGCRFTWISAGPIAAEGITVITDCYFSDNSVAGGGQFGTNTNAYVTIVKGCTVRSGNTGSVGVEMGHGIWYLLGNYIENAKNEGIVTDFGYPIPFFMIKDNVVKNCPKGGIAIWGENHNFIIQGNICTDDLSTHIQKYGIRVIDPASSNYIIKDNICSNNTVKQIEDNGTGTNKIVKDNITLGP